MHYFMREQEKTVIRKHIHKLKNFCTAMVQTIPSRIIEE